MVMVMASLATSMVVSVSKLAKLVFTMVILYNSHSQLPKPNYQINPGYSA
jgi:hypothetical protein